MIYFDQAASSFPKPKTVGEAVLEAINEYAANPGRGGHALSVRAAEKVYQTRAKLANFFGLQDPRHVFFYQNATGALNQAILGLNLQKGDHVITTSFEHNSVRRPLEYVKETVGIDVTYIHAEQSSEIEQSIADSIKETTKLIVATHGSNVTGMIIPIEKIGKLAKEHQLLFLVDASQTAGVLPIHMEDMNIDMLAFAGHKGLLGPQGTGALLVKSKLELTPIIFGGTGSHSEAAAQPDVWPERFESGTLNTPGIAGLYAGVEEVERLTLERIFAHEWKLTSKLMTALEKVDGITLLGPGASEKRLAVVSFVMEGVDSHEIALILDQHYHIAVRAGIHCSPLAHETMGTLNTGAVRVSLGPYNTEQEVDTFIQAMEEIKLGLLG